MTRKKKGEFGEDVSTDFTIEERLFQQLVKGEFAKIADTCQRAADILDKDVLVPVDFQYALKQMDILTLAAMRIIHLARAGMMMFDGHGVEKSWATHTRHLPLMKEEREALASLDSSIREFNARP